ncbi:hypothetical protein C8Q80DRAFT_1214949 [Daedaleopsis nitida]|nr:hypothetical protein C8Q80DRAFT_1214949 [Daedaleopsis nitida]
MPRRRPTTAMPRQQRQREQPPMRDTSPVPWESQWGLKDTSQLPTMDDMFSVLVPPDRAAQAANITRIHEAVYDRPPILPAAYKKLDELIILKQELYYDYRQQPDYETICRDTVQVIEDYPYERLQRGLEQKDCPMMLELGIRSLMDMTANFELLESLTALDLPVMDSRGKQREQMHGSTFEHRKRALAACAWLSLLHHFEGKPERVWSLHTLKDPCAWLSNAAHQATMLCWQEPIPPIALRIASCLMQIGRWYRVDIRTVEGTERFGALWRTYDDFLIWQAEREQQRVAKVLFAPNRYQCAADGCGIQAINSRALRRCGGDCSDESKAHYCNLHCQKKHWFIHRSSCKRGLSTPPIEDDDGNPDWVDVDEHDTKYTDHIPLPDHRLLWSFKGDIIRIRSSTFSPEFLRAYRVLWYPMCVRNINAVWLERDSRKPDRRRLCMNCGLAHE